MNIGKVLSREIKSTSYLKKKINWLKGLNNPRICEFNIYCVFIWWITHFLHKCSYYFKYSHVYFERKKKIIKKK